MPTREQDNDQLFVAKETFWTGHPPELIKGGETMVRSGDPLLEAYPENFERAQSTRPTVEQMTAAPGEQRGAR